MFNELIKAAKDIKDKIVAIRDDVYPVKSWFDDYIETGNLVPPKDDNYDLGSKDRQWRKIYGGTIAADVSLNQIPVMDDAHVPDLETLSYGGPFNVDQIPGLPGSKITSGTISAAVDVVDGAIPNVETLSYGGAFALAQIPGIPNSKLDNSAVTITTGNALTGGGPIALGDSGTIDVVEGGIDISNLTGTALDAQIPDVETLSYSGRFAGAQIPWSGVDTDINLGGFDLRGGGTVVANDAIVDPAGAVHTGELADKRAVYVSNGVTATAGGGTVSELIDRVELREPGNATAKEAAVWKKHIGLNPKTPSNIRIHSENVSTDAPNAQLNFEFGNVWDSATDSIANNDSIRVQINTGSDIDPTQKLVLNLKSGGTVDTVSEAVGVTVDTLNYVDTSWNGVDTLSVTVAGGGDTNSLKLTSANYPTVILKTLRIQALDNDVDNARNVDFDVVSMEWR